MNARQRRLIFEMIRDQHRRSEAPSIENRVDLPYATFSISEGFNQSSEDEESQRPITQSQPTSQHYPHMPTTEHQPSSINMQAQSAHSLHNTSQIAAMYPRPSLADIGGAEATEMLAEQTTPRQPQLHDNSLPTTPNSSQPPFRHIEDSEMPAEQTPPCPQIPPHIPISESHNPVASPPLDNTQSSKALARPRRRVQQIKDRLAATQIIPPRYSSTQIEAVAREIGRFKDGEDDHVITKGDIKAIVSKHIRPNHQNVKADVDFVNKIHPIFCLRILFPAVVSIVQNRFRTRSVLVISRDDIPEEAVAIYNQLARPSSKAIWTQIDYMHAVYRMSMYINNEAVRLRVDGGIDQGRVGSHTNISIAISIKWFMCLSSGLTMEALAQLKIDNSKKWVS